MEYLGLPVSQCLLAVACSCRANILPHNGGGRGRRSRRSVARVVSMVLCRCWNGPRTGCKLDVKFQNLRILRCCCVFNSKATNNASSKDPPTAHLPTTPGSHQQHLSTTYPLIIPYPKRESRGKIVSLRSPSQPCSDLHSDHSFLCVIGSTICLQRGDSPLQVKTQTAHVLKLRF